MKKMKIILSTKIMDNKIMDNNKLKYHILMTKCKAFPLRSIIYHLRSNKNILNKIRKTFIKTQSKQTPVSLSNADASPHNDANKSNTKQLETIYTTIILDWLTSKIGQQNLKLNIKHSPGRLLLDQVMDMIN